MVKHLLSREAVGAAPFPFGVLLLVFYALCTHVVVATTAWLAFTRRRVREISRRRFTLESP